MRSKAKNRRLVAVLGAPRSGLTTISKVLESMGVRFGSAADPDRSRGTPADQEAEINDTLLTHLGSGRDRLGSVESPIPRDAVTRGLGVRAFQFLANRFAGPEASWGLKDPATTRMLDFWKRVFPALDAEVSFVLAVRNPASVAASLAARDAIPAEKAYFLWLQHVLPSALLTAGARRVVVDYDRLLEDPRAQMARISAALLLPWSDAGDVRIAKLESALRKSGRRHAHCTPADLASDGRASKLVGSAYRLLDQLATDQEPSPGLAAGFEELNQQLSLAAPAFDYIKSLEDAHRHLERKDAEREARAAEVSRALAVRAAPPRPGEPVPARHELPPGFDPALYLELHPDLAGSFEWAIDHYLRHGRYEGRGFTLPEIDELNEDGFREGRETILAVSHEASRTGAPLLTLGLVQANVDRYNVVALLLGEGPLRDAFRKAGAAVVMSPRMKGNPVVTESVIRRLHERFNFSFALVNSIESRAVLPALGLQGIPSVSLLHEFAAYTRPAAAFRDAFFWSSEVVFSTRVTLDNAHAELPELPEGVAHVLPQGRCLVPAEGLTDEQLQSEQGRIRRLMRPGGADDRSVVVLGAGSVHLRKGVDLFIQCAARAMQVAPGIDYRFVWMGAGYDPRWDAAYSVYLADQIRRAGLEGRVVFIDESVAIETAYEEADLFLLSSRLDPLPNVAIESMAFGLPVLCFDRTTGIADFLNGAGLGNYCVASFLDSADMAEKLSVLAASRPLREEIGERSREASLAFFDSKQYFADLGAVARRACDRVRQEKEDAQVILDSGLFRKDFALEPYLASLTIPRAIRRHVRAWASGLDRRKPFPGFHPGIYLEQHGLAIADANPLAEYLRAGRPEGPWNFPVIGGDGDEGRARPDDQRVALHLHVHYPELLSEIITRLSRNRARPDLLVSVTSEQARASVGADLDGYGGRVIAIELTPNRGRDIGPLLTAFGRRILSDYDYIGHLHTKKTAAVKDAGMGAAWYRFLLENLIGGGSGAMADRILAAMHADPSIGMAFPDDPHVVGWGANRGIADRWARKVGLGPLPEHWNFPVGTMFWARTEALAPFVGLDLGWEDYPEEPLPYDGTLLHAIERLLPMTLSSMQLRSATTNVFGCTR